MSVEPITIKDVRKQVLDEVFVHVDIPSHNGFGMASPDELERRANDVVNQIKRHVDATGAYVEKTYSVLCPDCTCHWTEDSHTYNGGCCDADQIRGAATGEIDDEHLEINRRHDPTFDSRVDEYRRRQLDTPPSREGVVVEGEVLSPRGEGMVPMDTQFALGAAVRQLPPGRVQIEITPLGESGGEQ